MGLSLLVPKDAKELRVTVRWGDYRPLQSGAEEEQEGGNGGRRFMTAAGRLRARQ